jgi:hypothetical protein
MDRIWLCASETGTPERTCRSPSGAASVSVRRAERPSERVGICKTCQVTRQCEKVAAGVTGSTRCVNRRAIPAHIGAVVYIQVIELTEVTLLTTAPMVVDFATPIHTNGSTKQGAGHAAQPRKHVPDRDGGE